MYSAVQPEQLSVIRSKASAYAPHQLALLEQFSTIDCGTGDLEGNQKVVQILLEELSHLPVQVSLESGKNGSHVIARILPEHPTGKIIINSHLDTVFHPGDAAAHPFHVDGEYAYGLGVADCKGGFVTSAYGVRIAYEAGLLPQKEIVMIYNCDEETGSVTSRDLFEREAKNSEYAFVFEPGRDENGLVTSRKGCASIQIEVIGREAHAGLNYTGGADASLELARWVTFLSEQNDPQKGMYFNAGFLSSGKHADIVSDHAQANFFFAFPTQKDYEQIALLLSAKEKQPFVKGCSVKTKLELLFPPMEATETNLKAYHLVADAGAQLGLPLPQQSSSGSSDACWFSSFHVATVDALGPYMKDIHTTKERVKIDTIQQRTELFAVVLAGMK